LTHNRYNIRMKMKIETVLDVTPELASDIQYLWDESDLTSEQIAEVASPSLQSLDNPIPLEVVWDVLGGAYNEADHKEHIAHYENHTH